MPANSRWDLIQGFKGYRGRVWDLGEMRHEDITPSEMVQYGVQWRLMLTANIVEASLCMFVVDTIWSITNSFFSLRVYSDRSLDNQSINFFRSIKNLIVVDCWSVLQFPRAGTGNNRCFITSLILLQAREFVVWVHYITFITDFWITYAPTTTFYQELKFYPTTTYCFM